MSVVLSLKLASWESWFPCIFSYFVLRKALVNANIASRIKYRRHMANLIEITIKTYRHRQGTTSRSEGYGVRAFSWGCLVSCENMPKSTLLERTCGRERSNHERKGFHQPWTGCCRLLAWSTYPIASDPWTFLMVSWSGSTYPWLIYYILSAIFYYEG